MFEYFKNVIESYRERLSNPILGTYTVSFIICNWRPLLILISSNASIEENIKVINETYSFWEAVLWPILITFIIVLLVPYLMMGLDYAISKSSLFRKKIKNAQMIFDYDHKVQIASREFDIQNIKSGTRTIEMMQSNIDSLEKDKENLISQISQQKENEHLEISALTDLLKIEKDKNLSKQNAKSLEIPLSVFETYNTLELSGRLEEFIDTYDFYGSYAGTTQLTNYYQDLGLIRYSTGTYGFSDIANQLYNLLFELNNENDHKKKIKSAIEKLNKHEVSIISGVDKRNPILDISGFNQPLAVQLTDHEFIKINKTGDYILTQKGFELRNIVGITTINEY